MQDILSDFYKRFPPNGNYVDKIFYPTPLILFGTPGSRLQPLQTVLSMSFGASAAVRRRNDDRIVLTFANSDIISSINTIYLKEKTDNEIFSAMALFPMPLSGAEMLISSNTYDKSCEKFCALIAELKTYDADMSPEAILHITKESPIHIASLIGAKSIHLNSQTLEYIPTECDFHGRKFVIARVSNPKKFKMSAAFSMRENRRSEIAAAALFNSDINVLGELMNESGADRLADHRAPSEAMLYEIFSEIAYTTVLPDFSGTVSLVDDGLVDDFIMSCGLKYEKKTGARPAFYISD